MPEQLESSAPGLENALLQCRLSWTVYVRQLVMLALLWGVALGAQRYMPQWVLPVWGVVGLLSVVIVYTLCWLRTVRLVATPSGVWLYRGILPWRRGAVGIKWRDMEDAAFVPGFGSWLLNTYDIRVGNRFARSHDLVMNHAYGGREVVTRLNELHSRFCAAADAPADGEADMR